MHPDDQRRLLRSHRWCWPREQQTAEWGAACELAGAPPELQRGQGLLLAVNRQETAAGAFAMTIDPRARADVAVGLESQDAWENACDTIARTIPYLWVRLDVLRSRLPRLSRVGVVSLEKNVMGDVSPADVDGASFGLSFLLGLASYVLERPLPDDLVASATLLRGGGVGKVEGLRGKLAALHGLAPRVLRVIVASEQGDEAAKIADKITAESGRAIETRPVRDVSGALHAAFGDDLALSIVDRSRDQISHFVDQIFHLALRDRQQIVCWKPVECAAQLARRNWKNLLDADQERRLAFSEAVAARHERNEGLLPELDQNWLQRLNPATATEVIAHYVQSVVDTPHDAHAERIPTLVARWLPQPVRSRPEELKVHGALARLWSITGSSQDALARQEEAAEVWRMLNHTGEISYPLSEWYRLSGALGDGAALERADRFSENLLTETQALLREESPFVRLARARAAVLLGRDADRRASEDLRALCRDLHVPDHVRHAAIRSLLRIAPDPDLLEDLEAAAGRDRTARAQLALVSLDRALAEQSGGASARCLEELGGLAPGIIPKLIAAADRLGEQRDAYVARFYLY